MLDLLLEIGFEEKAENSTYSSIPELSRLFSKIIRQAAKKGCFNSGAKDFNSLPNDVKQITSLLALKSRLGNIFWPAFDSKIIDVFLSRDIFLFCILLFTLLF